MATDASRTTREIVSWLNAIAPEPANWQDLTARLTTLKELSRVKADAEALYTLKSIDTLCAFAFEPTHRSQEWSMEAKRCLANALTLEDRTVPYFLQSNGLARLIGFQNKALAACSSEEEFLYSRILFLVTAKTGRSVDEDIQKERSNLVFVIGTWVHRHSSRITAPSKSTENKDQKIPIVCLCELLKLLYNLSLFTNDVFEDILTFMEDASTRTCTVILRLITTLRKYEDDSVKIAIPHCINLMTNMDLSFERQEAVHLLESLSSVLDEFITAMLEDQPWCGLQISEAQVTPLLTVFANLFDSFDISSEGKDIMKSKLLVSSKERSVPLGKSESMAAKLLKLLNTSTQALRECISALLYKVSDSSPARFVENIGYGHAIGFLTTHGIPLDTAQLSKEHDGVAINPITGQRFADEEADIAQKELKEMTDEEKEREAEKLFVLFQRLKKTGVIDVKDPIQQAVDEGRFQELSM